MKTSIKFSLRKKRNNTIYCVITIDGVRTEVSTGISLDASEHWTGVMIRGRSDKSNKQNERLRNFYVRIDEIISNMAKKGIPYTPDELKGIIRKKKGVPGEGVAEITEALRIALKEKKDIKEKTIREYGFNIDALEKYIEEKQLKIPFHQLDKMFAVQLVDHMTEQGKKFSTRRRMIASLSSLTKHLLMRHHDFLKPPTNPFLNVPDKKTESEKPTSEKYLSEEELSNWATSKLPEEYERVRKTFLFQCYTGLAHNELMSFDPDKHIVKTMEGHKMIRIQRKKTELSSGTMSTIPVFGETEKLLEYFRRTKPENAKNHLHIRNTMNYNYALAKVSSEIGMRRVTSHMGRHTFGVIMLQASKYISECERDFSMEAVRQMLGHSSILMTERVYAKVTEAKVMNEFKLIRKAN